MLHRLNGLWRRVSAAAVSGLMILGLLGASAVADEQTTAVRLTQHATLGTLLVDPNGMVLYTFDKDTKDTSNCYDVCAANWPPLLADSAESLRLPNGMGGTLGTTTRKDGKLQVTYNGMPLYTWAKDTVAGEAAGHGFNSIWWAVNPAATATVRITANPQLGDLLTDAAGMTLYVFSKDAVGISNCFDSCLQKWPPLLVSDGEPIAPPGLSGTLGTITRPDGARQVTLNGAPLYYWQSDIMPGETSGHTVGNAWWVARPGHLLDVAGHWSELEVVKAVKAGWIQGRPDKTFNPEGQVTRAEFVKMIMGAFGEFITSGSSFSDTSNHWAAEYIEGAVEAGILKPSEYSNGRFEPDRAITREEIAVMAVRALGLEAETAAAADSLAKFSDAQTVSAAFRGHVGLAVEKQIVGGYENGTVRGNGTATRAEAVVMVLRALGHK